MPAVTFGWKKGEKAFDYPPVRWFYSDNSNEANIPRWSGYSGDYSILMDMNGDNLPDRLEHYDYHSGMGNGLWVSINNGQDGFYPKTKWFQDSVENDANIPRWSGINGDNSILLDMDGDGLPDRVEHYDYQGGQGNGLWVSINNGQNGFYPKAKWFQDTVENDANIPRWNGINGDNSILLDMDGDGLPDRVEHCDYGSGQYGIWVSRNKGDGFDTTNKTRWFFDAHANNANIPRWSGSSGDTSILMDINGDGLPDRVEHYDYGTDQYGIWVSLNNGNKLDTTNKKRWFFDAHANNANIPRWSGSSGDTSILMDMNGDGLPDRVEHYDYGSEQYGIWVSLNTGTKLDTTNKTRWFFDAHENNANIPRWSDNKGDRSILMDINGDGLPDRVEHYDYGTEEYGLWISLNNGDGFDAKTKWFHNSEKIEANYPRWSENKGDNSILLDMNGDGLPDRVAHNDYEGGGYGLWVYLNLSAHDLLTSISTGTGGTTTLDYEPSSTYTNRFLPFVVQTLSKVTVNDGSGIDTITEYDYSNGYYDFAEREFRGFETVRATTRSSTHDGTYTETTFKGCDPDDPDNDIYKGLPAESVTKDASDNIYAKTINTYDYTEPVAGSVYFPRLRTKEDFICDGFCDDSNMNTESLKSKTEFDYDIYGNIEEKRFFVEGQSGLVLDKVEETDYAPYDTTNWLLALPKTVYMRDGSRVRKAQTNYTYFTGTGNLKTEEKWLSTDDSYLVTAYTYDAYGNVDTATDPRGTVTKYEYDATFTFPEKVTNDFGGLGFFTQTTYDPIFIDKVSITTDYNSNPTQYTYDEFGRVKTVTKPAPYGITEYTYDDINRIKTLELKDRGGVVLQWQKTYYDGLGRTITEKSYGTGVTTIIVDTEYNDRGQVYRKSNPYFDGAGNVYYTTYTYDAVNRLTDILNSDGTSSSVDYDRGWTIYTDANDHQKMVQKDIYGQIINVEEYIGDGSTEDPYALYATTEYEYDVLGNLTQVTDAASPPNITTISYDSLSRKKNMTDSDMGFWQYEYDANGNLMQQTDAKSQVITFDPYDALNRVTKKNYPDGSYVQYIYDEAFSSNSKGRLTRVKEFDNQAIITLETKTHYDELGNITRTDRILDGITYTTVTAYDVLERVESITYPAPDNIVVNYAYDGHGNVETISSGGTDYITYHAYNAFAQPLQVEFGNNVITDYTYSPENNRLQSIVTTSSLTGVIMNLSYSDYDGVGNILRIEDNLDNIQSRSFKYDELDRLVEADSTQPGGSGGIYGGKLIYQYDEIGNMTYNCRFGHYTYDPNHPHAVKEVRRTDGTLAAWYIYDDNGNMISSEEYDTNGVLEPGKSRTFIYNYDNMPTRITTGGLSTDLTYDANGTRIKKDGSTGITTYIGSIYECTDGACTKHILSDTQLIASLEGAETFYYHTDHLGSSSLITDADGTGDEVVQVLFYYPYGEIKYNTSTENVNMKYKFTGKEWDGDSGLYYYGARYYDPKLTRFISADTIVPKPFYPVSLNRYAYAYNNPIILKDLDGHSIWGDLFVLIASWFAAEQDSKDSQAYHRNRGYNSSSAGNTYGGNYPNSTPAYIDYNPYQGLWDYRHEILAGAGMAPGAGIVPDFLDTCLCLLEGDWEGAAGSGMAMWPGLGQVTRAAQYSRKAANGLGTTRLWRAVESAELQDVMRYGDYNIHPNSTFKRFAFDEASLDNFIKANPDRNYTKTYIDLATDKVDLMYRHPDPGGVGKSIGIDVYETPEFYNWFDKVNVVE